jgi:hypothetical protein
VQWPGVIEHTALVDSATYLLDDLQGLPGRLVHGDVHHAIHTDFAERARSLALYLSAALILTRQDNYGPAFTLVRTSLEHCLLDSLIFLGRRYVQIAEGIDEEQWNDWLAARERGEEWTTTIREWTRTRKGEVRIVREGLYTEEQDAEDQERRAIAIHYFLLQEYSPFVGSPREQALFEDGLTPVEERREWAKHNRLLYETYLRWTSLKESLRFNDLATDKQLEQFDVHYRFLSAFVHPLAEVTALLYGRNRPWPAYDHYASELVLLYLNLLAARELTHFARMASQAPSVAVAGWSETRRRCDVADRLCSHLWFPGQGPHAYDRWVTANQRAFAILSHPSRREEVTRPEDLNDTEVRYYRNPLQRLVEMHMSPREIITGFTYQSPWQRNDAQFR